MADCKKMFDISSENAIGNEFVADSMNQDENLLSKVGENSKSSLQNNDINEEKCSSQNKSLTNQVCHEDENLLLPSFTSANCIEVNNDSLPETTIAEPPDFVVKQIEKNDDCEKQISENVDTCPEILDLNPTVSVQSSLLNSNVNNHLQTCGTESLDVVSLSNEIKTDSNTLISSSSTDLSSHEQLNDIVELISDEYKGNSSVVSSLDVDSILVQQEPLDLDENTTQPRVSPCLSPENTFANNSSTNHMFIETTLIAHPAKDNSPANFQEMTCHLPTSNDEDSDKESILSAENTDFAASTSLAAVEESSLDSGIASLDDAEKTSSTESQKSSTSSATSASKLSPSSILGKKRPYCELSTASSSEQQKSESSKSRVAFNGVTVFYFPRKQSFVTVPSQGGSTLGMSLKHSYSKRMSLNQHKRAIARHHRKTIEEQKKQLKLNAKLKQLKQAYPEMESCQLMAMITAESDLVDGKSQDSSGDELNEDDDDCASSDDDFDDDNYFLQPIPAKKRRMLLRMAGVQKIDLDEKFLNKITRESREVCGCSCVRFCIPSSCQCALAGIPCQVDRESFPCGCLATGCCNPNGRVEFDADRVKRHYAKTMKKLRLQETGLLPREELTELPQPPKSPYACYPEHNEDSSQSSNTMQQFHELNVETVPSCYDNNAQVNGTLSLPSVSSTLLDSWPGTYNNPNSSNYYSFDFNSNDTSVIDNLEITPQSNGPSFFGSSTLCDVTSSFNDVNPAYKQHLTTVDYLLPGSTSVSYTTSSHDFSFAEPELHLPGETTLVLGLGQSPQLGYRQTHKLEPIASFFSSNGRRSSEEFGSVSLDIPEIGDGEVVVSPLLNSPSCKQSCSIESLLDEPTSSRSRSSSLSECNHDSVLKA